MNRCENCNVKVFESEHLCPLCHREVAKAEQTSSTAVEYPDYQQIKKHRSALWNVPFFVSFAASLLCVYINIFTHQPGNIIWSIIVVAALFYVSCVISVIKSTANRFGSKVVKNYILLSVFLFVVDIMSGMHYWFTNFVFPFLTVATTIYLTVLAVRSKRLFSEYFGYILVVTAFGLIPIPIYLLGLSDVAWGMFVSVTSSIIIALGLYFFSDKTFKQEIKKRFHR